jgi:hypothetical protein
MGLCRKAREARVTETVPANPVMNGATNPITIALPTGTGWQAAPAAGARTEPPAANTTTTRTP